MVKYIYTLGAAGERLKVTELDRTVEYTYDDLYRLTSETITEGEKVTTVYTYAYDSVSNRILKNENGKETAYVYNALNQLVSDSDTTYEYDLNGNLVRVIGSAHSALYEFNAENRLVKATVQQGNNVIEESYTYDYAGNRTSKTTRTNGHVEFVKYLNDTNSELTNVLCELDENGTEKCVYTIGADLVSQERDGKVSVYIYDGHGSVVGLALMNGKVTDTYTYDAFGNLLTSTGSTKNCYRYCGEQFDETTGLYYLRARYMDSSTGRFISQDSYQGNVNDPVSLHKYLYVNSNPVMNADPSGYAPVSEKIDEVVIVIIILLPTAGVSAAQAKHDAAVLETGNKIIRLLKAISPLIGYASIWGVAIGAMISDVLSGEITSSDTADEIRRKIINNALPENDKEDIKQGADYYLAKTSKGEGAIVYDSVPLTLNAARRSVMQGEDVFCTSKQSAILLAFPFGGLTEREPRPNSWGRRNGDAYHYHLANYELFNISMGFRKSHIFVDEGENDEFLRHVWL